MKDYLLKILLFSSVFGKGTSYISALFFAWLSDGKFGRARTIILGR